MSEIGRDHGVEDTAQDGVRLAEALMLAAMAGAFLLLLTAMTGILAFAYAALPVAGLLAARGVARWLR